MASGEQDQVRRRAGEVDERRRRGAAGGGSSRRSAAGRPQPKTGAPKASSSTGSSTEPKGSRWRSGFRREPPERARRRVAAAGRRPRREPPRGPRSRGAAAGLHAGGEEGVRGPRSAGIVRGSGGGGSGSREPAQHAARLGATAARPLPRGASRSQAAGRATRLAARKPARPSGPPWRRTQRALLRPVWKVLTGV